MEEHLKRTFQIGKVKHSDCNRLFVKHRRCFTAPSPELRQAKNLKRRNPLFRACYRESHFVAESKFIVNQWRIKLPNHIAFGRRSVFQMLIALIVQMPCIAKDVKVFDLHILKLVVESKVVCKFREPCQVAWDKPSRVYTFRCNIIPELRDNASGGIPEPHSLVKLHKLFGNALYL